jgi:hypothetical protein
MRRWGLIAIGVCLAASVALAAWLLPTSREHSPVTFARPRAKSSGRWTPGRRSRRERRRCARPESGCRPMSRPPTSRPTRLILPARCPTDRPCRYLDTGAWHDGEVHCVRAYGEW